MRRVLVVAGAVAIVALIGVLIYMSMDTLPEGVTEGMVIRCSNGKIYKVEGGKKRHYSNYGVYTAAGKPAYKTFGCNVVASIPDGAPFV